MDKVLLSHREVEDALSFPVPDQRYGQEIYAAVLPRPGHAVSEDDLKDYCRSVLGESEVPKRIFFPASIPRNGKGTGDRRRLAERLRRGRQRV